MANGKSDIKLLDDFDGQVEVAAPDFCVDGGPGRRKGSTTQYRRALVHDGDDGLNINWANDYVGGVTINGVKAVNGHPDGVTINGLKKIATGHPLAIESGFFSFQAGAAEFIGALIHLECQPEQAGGVKITGDVQFTDNAQFHKDVMFDGTLKLSRTIQVGRNMAPQHIEIPDLLSELLRLSNEISQLKDRVAKLEQKP